MGTSPTINKTKRFAILKEVYASTGANPTKSCNVFQIGRDLAFAQDETIGIIEYLHTSGLIEKLAPLIVNIGDPKDPDEAGLAKITPKGIDEFEKVLDGKQSEYFPPYSTMIAYPEIINRQTSQNAGTDSDSKKEEIIDAVSKQSPKKWDVFISHASEDKESFVRPFAEALHEQGLSVWYDEFELDWGKKLSASIDEGLSNSSFGIVVFSKNFFAKEWTQAELGGLYTRMIGAKKNNLLPILHNMTQQELAQKSPLMADIMNRSSLVGLGPLVQEVYEIVSKAKTSGTQQVLQTSAKPTPPTVDPGADSQFDDELKGVESGSPRRPDILNKIESTLFWRVNLRPIAYSSKLLTLQKAKEIVANSTIRLRGWDYPFHNASAIQHGLNYVQEAVDFRSHSALWRMYESGQFFHEFAGIEDGEPTVPEKSLLVLATLYSFTEIYEFARKLAEKGVFGQHATISIELHKLQDRSLRMLEFGRELYPDYRSIEDSLPIRKILSKKELSETSHELALNDTVWILERFGWTGSYVTEMLRKDQEKFLKGLI